MLKKINYLVVTFCFCFLLSTVLFLKNHPECETRFKTSPRFWIKKEVDRCVCVFVRSLCPCWLADRPTTPQIELSLFIQISWLHFSAILKTSDCCWLALPWTPQHLKLPEHHEHLKLSRRSSRFHCELMSWWHHLLWVELQFQRGTKAAVGVQRSEWFSWTRC